VPFDDSRAPAKGEPDDDVEVAFEVRHGPVQTEQVRAVDGSDPAR
jgi:hypothetical protein